MRIWVNGQPREVAPGATVADVLTALGAPQAGVAVAVDGELVRRAAWESSRLAPRARVEVLTAVQGG